MIIHLLSINTAQIRAGLDGRVGHFRLMTSPGLKLPTQFQMDDDHILKFMIS